MVTSVDIANRALSEIAARATIVTLGDNTPAAKACALWIDATRQELLRAAPWGFARRTVAMTSLGLLTDDPPASPYPWLAKYTYPADAIRINYILPQPAASTNDVAPNVSDIGFTVPWCMPSRSWRFLIANDPAVIGTGAHAERKVVLANITDALAVYVGDITDPELMEPSFISAWQAYLSYKLTLPITGNLKLKPLFKQLVEDILLKARAADGNEAHPSTEHTPDWIQARGLGGNPYNNGGNLGQWYQGWDSIAWAE